MIKKDNWVYIHVPKTAGTTTENLFRDHHNLIVEDEVHTTVYDIEDKIDKFIFGFVRNPYSSEWSLWNYCHHSWGIFKDFDEWCAFRFGGKKDECYEKYEHLPVQMHDGSRDGSKTELDYCYDLFIRSQAGYFCDENQKCIASKIYRFEQLRESWDDIQKRIHMDIKMNVVERLHKDDYKKVYTDYSYDLVSKYKAKDIELFGYDFDGFEGDCPLDYSVDYVGQNYAYSR
tara:strand:+ start:237 stop:926 length:690 start_codon:yes stop_codon:yes gene_type:complete